MSIKKNYVVTKRNVLNEIRANNMTLQELRFFSIYLSKINPSDINTRVVRFSLSDFQRIMDLGKLNIKHLNSTIDSLLCKVIKVPNEENSGYTAFQLFKECKIELDEYKNWYIEIDAHDKALPLMFEFKNKYFTYQLWNALQLKSSNQLRMYEILKQYEKVKERIISVDELKELLGLDPTEYKRFGDFRMEVLEVCRVSLESNTDITFRYEPTGKRGRGGKIFFLKFIIEKNDKYVDKLSLDEFLSKPICDDNKQISKIDERINFISDAFGDEFSNSELQIFYNTAMKVLSYEEFSDDLKLFHFFSNKYDEMTMRSEHTKIRNKFAYLKKLIESEIS